MDLMLKLVLLLLLTIVPWSSGTSSDCSCFSAADVGTRCDSSAEPFVREAFANYGTRCLNRNQELYCYSNPACGLPITVNCARKLQVPTFGCVESIVDPVDRQRLELEAFLVACSVDYNYTYRSSFQAGSGSVFAEQPPLVLRIGAALSITGRYATDFARVSSFLRQAFRMIQIAAGLGLVTRLDGQKIEFTYCIVDDESDPVVTREIFTSWATYGSPRRVDFMITPGPGDLAQVAIDTVAGLQQDADLTPPLIHWAFETVDSYSRGVGENLPIEARAVNVLSHLTSTDAQVPPSEFRIVWPKVPAGKLPNAFSVQAQAAHYPYEALRQLKDQGARSLAALLGADTTRISGEQLDADRRVCQETVDMAVTTLGYKGQYYEVDRFGARYGQEDVLVICGYDIEYPIGASIIAALGRYYSAIVLARPVLHRFQGLFPAFVSVYAIDSLPWACMDFLTQTSFPLWGRLTDMISSILGTECFEADDRKCSPMTALQFLAAFDVIAAAARLARNPFSGNALREVMLSQTILTTQGYVRFQADGQRGLPLEPAVGSFTCARQAFDSGIPPRSRDLEVGLRRERTLHVRPLTSVRASSEQEDMDSIANVSDIVFPHPSFDGTRAAFDRCLEGCEDFSNALWPFRCAACGVGRYKTPTEPVCRACPSGHYADQEGQTACKPCQPGSNCSTIDGEIPRSLAPKAYPGFARLDVPITGVYRNLPLAWLGDRLPPTKPLDLLCTAPAILEARFVQCIPSAACLGGNLCSPETGGTMCKACREDYTHDVDGVCTKCINRAVVGVFFGINFICVVALVWIVSVITHRAATDMSSTTVPLLRMLIHHLQALAVMRDSMVTAESFVLESYEIPSLLGYLLTQPWRLMGFTCWWEAGEAKGQDAASTALAKIWWGLAISWAWTLSGLSLILISYAIHHMRQKQLFKAAIDAEKAETLIIDDQPVVMSEAIAVAKAKELHEMRRSFSSVPGHHPHQHVGADTAMVRCWKNAKKSIRSILGERCYRLLLCRRSAQKPTVESSIEPSVLASVGRKQIAKKNYRVWILRLSLITARVTTTRQLTVWLLLSYSATLHGVIESISCDYEGGLHRHQNDWDLICGEGDHLGIAIFAVLSAIILVFLVPLFMFLMMRKALPHVRAIGLRRRAGFLFIGYRKSKSWFECVYFLKIGLLACTKLLEPSDRATSQLAILVGGALMLAAHDPYVIVDCSVLPWISIASDVSLCITLFCNIGMARVAQRQFDAPSKRIDVFLTLFALFGNNPRSWEAGRANTWANIYRGTQLAVNIMFILMVFFAWLQNRSTFWGWVEHNLQERAGPLGRLLLFIRVFLRERHTLWLEASEHNSKRTSGVESKEDGADKTQGDTNNVIDPEAQAKKLADEEEKQNALMTAADQDALQMHFDVVNISQLSARAKAYLMESMQECLVAQAHGRRLPANGSEYMLYMGLARAAQLRHERIIASEANFKGHVGTRGHLQSKGYIKLKKVLKCLVAPLERSTMTCLRYLIFGTANPHLTRRGQTMTPAAQARLSLVGQTHAQTSPKVTVEELHVGMQSTSYELAKGRTHDGGRFEQSVSDYKHHSDNIPKETSQPGLSRRRSMGSVTSTDIKSFAPKAQRMLESNMRSSGGGGHAKVTKMDQVEMKKRYVAALKRGTWQSKTYDVEVDVSIVAQFIPTEMRRDMTKSLTGEAENPQGVADQMKDQFMVHKMSKTIADWNMMASEHTVPDAGDQGEAAAAAAAAVAATATAMKDPDSELPPEDPARMVVPSPDPGHGAAAPDAATSTPSPTPPIAAKLREGASPDRIVEPRPKRAALAREALGAAPPPSEAEGAAASASPAVTSETAPEEAAVAGGAASQPQAAAVQGTQGPPPSKPKIYV